MRGRLERLKLDGRAPGEARWVGKACRQTLAHWHPLYQIIGSEPTIWSLKRVQLRSQVFMMATLHRAKHMVSLSV